MTSGYVVYLGPWTDADIAEHAELSVRDVVEMRPVRAELRRRACALIGDFRLRWDFESGLAHGNVSIHVTDRWPLSDGRIVEVRKALPYGSRLEASYLIAHEVAWMIERLVRERARIEAAIATASRQ